MNDLLFLMRRSLRGLVVRWARQIRQPKYLLGSLVAVAWISFWVLPSFARSGIRIDFLEGGLESMRGVLPLIEFVASAAIALWLAFGWLLPFGKIGLPFREAELHLLLPAPVTRRNLIQYALLKSQFAIVVTASVFTLFLHDGTLGGAARAWVGVWLVFTLFEWHNRFRSMQYIRLHGPESTGARPWRLVKVLLAGGFVALVLVRLRGVGLEARRHLLGLSGVQEAGLGPVIDALGAAAADPLLQVVLEPFRWIVGPLFADGPRAFSLALLPPLALLVLLHEGIVRSTARFEEPALRHAETLETKRDKERGRRRTGRGPRTARVYRLRPDGPPAAAIVWKNLMQVHRHRLSTTLGLATAFLVLLYWVPSTLGAPGWVFYLPLIFGLWGFVFMPLIVALGGRLDLRNDFAHVEVVRTWPVGGTAFVWAEVLSPTIVASLLSLFSGSLAVAAVAGARRVERLHETTLSIRILPQEMAAGAGPGEVGWLLLLLLAAWPVVACATLVVCALQNAGALLFPAWVGAGDMKPSGLAASGQSVIVASALGLIMLFASVPAALLIGAALLLADAFDVAFALWWLPALSLLAAIPYLVEAALINRLGGALWARLDPAREILEGGS